MEMPWEGRTMEGYREEFVQRVLRKEDTKSALCRDYGISRPTGDKWIGRYLQGESMSDRSKVPFHTPNRTCAVVEKTIVDMRVKHPAIGAKKLKKMLENQGKPSPAYSTINAILHRNGLISKEASQAATPHQRFEKAAPNEMWQADFKGHFAMQNGLRCHPLTVIDDHSRYCLGIDAKENERHEGVKASFTRLFETYGLPESLLCDNGNPWGTAQSVGYTEFEVWLMDLGVLTKHGRARHPQTQGKDERFNGSLKRELIRWKTFEDYSHAQTLFDEYRVFYNTERPHHALDLSAPISRYVSSERRLPKRIYEWEYGSNVQTRQVKSSGYLSFNGQGYFLSQAFADKTVGLCERSEQPGIFLVCYRQFCIAKMNVNERSVVARRAFVLDKTGG
jgi:transposase InsO family protein